MPQGLQGSPHGQMEEPAMSCIWPPGQSLDTPPLDKMCLYIDYISTLSSGKLNCFEFRKVDIQTNTMYYFNTIIKINLKYSICFNSVLLSLAFQQLLRTINS